MDRLLATGSSLPLLPSFVSATRDAATAQSAPWGSPAALDPAAAVDSMKGPDPAAEQQRMLHFISHIDAECFISLLKMIDPPPDDVRDKAEYRRRYALLRQALELPTPSPTPLPITARRDPLW